MISKEILVELLQLESGWEPSEIRYDRTTGTRVVVITLAEAFLEKLICPQCNGREITQVNHEKKQVWRHMDGFCVKTLIECTLPHARCSNCRHVFQIKPCWQGKSRHFTKGFEAHALSLLRETSVRGASRFLCESDQRLWRMLFAYVEGLQGEISEAAINILHREWNITGGSARQRSSKFTSTLADDKTESAPQVTIDENAINEAVGGQK